MKLIADLHIHSKYSRATSSKLTPAYLDRWAGIKGIGLLGTGDCTHHKWLAELRENLEDAEPGFFTLKKDVRTAFDSGEALAEELPQPNITGLPSTRFVLSGEISTIYKRDGKTRKVHHLIILPDFKAAALLQTKLERVGNIVSDGRPILGIDSRNLLAMLLETDERSLLIPAHIWTPWFSVLGAQSGFDSVEECYGDLASFIPAVETGLSSDPPMNWSVSSLDRYSIVSNSDAHSPDKLGREATIFDMELSFAGLQKALSPGSGGSGILGTVEFFPEEGKYHCDGHRKCGVFIGTEDAVSGGGEKICPVCGKALTRGVLGRVNELADRPLGGTPPALKEKGNRRPFYSLIPLKEILGELLETGTGSKKVTAAYYALIEKAGSEFAILMDKSIEEIGRIKINGLSGELLGEAVDRMRRGQVFINAGYDGEYGVIKVFPPGTKIQQAGASLFSESNIIENNTTKNATPQKTGAKKIIGAKTVVKNAEIISPASFGFDAAQKKIINHNGERTLIIAGPGTGKTAVIAARIAKLINETPNPRSPSRQCRAPCPTILALSFTVKAAAELRERVTAATETAAAGKVMTATFHSFCCSLLREKAEAAGLPGDFEIAGESRRDELLKEICKSAGVKTGPAKLGRYIEERKRFLLLPGEEKPKPAPLLNIINNIQPFPEPVPELESLYGLYRNRLRELRLLDYDDLIAVTVRLLAVKQNILCEYRSRLKHIFVDEYQDINFSQYILLRLLADGFQPLALPHERPSLWVIGDPNQAIYGFRGSDKSFIDRFVIDYPEAKRFDLVKSFRCAGPIINAAGKLTGSKLKGTSKPVDFYRTEYPTDKSEAEGVARAISGLIGGASFFAKNSMPGQTAINEGQSGNYADTAAPGDCAVLVRAAPLAGPVVKALQDHGIPFVLTCEQPWWEEEPAKSFLAGIRECTSPDEEFQKEKSKPQEKHHSRITRLFELADLLGGVRPLLDALLYSDSGGLAVPDREGVHIMTIHAAKGLEFDHVFVTGLEDGMLPFTLYGESNPARLDEERRLLYVAMTRARVGLRLSFARSRNFKGRVIDGKPSPFLDELEKIIPLLEDKKTFKKDPQMSLF